MAASRELKVVILGDSTGAQRAFSQLEAAATSSMGRLEAVGQKFRDAGSKMVATGKNLTIGVTAPLALMGKASFDAASDVNESLSKVGAVFGDSAGDIDAFAKTAAKSLGQSRHEALDAAGTFGNLFTQLGIAAPEAASLSKEMIGLAADLGSFHNADISQVIEAQTAAFRGEYDSLQRFIPTINAATVEQRALEMTGKRTTKELTAQEKALAVQKLMMEGAGAAAGDFARTADGAANKQRIATAQFKDAAATLGNSLLPIGQKVIGFFSDLAARFGELSPRMQNFVVIGAAIAAALGPVVSVFGALAIVIGAVLSPVGLIVMAVAGLAAGIVYAYQRFEGFREVVAAVAAFFTDTAVPAVERLAAAVTAQLAAAVEWVKRTWPQISEAIGHVMTVVRTIIETAIGAVMALWRAWGDDIFAVVRTAFDYIRDSVNNALQIVSGIVRTVLAVINGDWSRAWDALRSVLSAVWDQIKNVVSTGVDTLKSIVGGIVSTFGEVLRPLGNFLHTWIVQPFEGIVSFVGGLPAKIASAASGMWDGIVSAFKGALNAVIRLWNGLRIPSFTVGGWDIPGPGPNVPSISTPEINFPNIPMLAHGGIVRATPGGTLALLGEAGQDEAVIPLPARPSPPPVVNYDVDVHVAGSVVSEGDLVESVYQGLLKLRRRNGDLGLA